MHNLSIKIELYLREKKETIVRTIENIKKCLNLNKNSEKKTPQFIPTVKYFVPHKSMYHEYP